MYKRVKYDLKKDIATAVSAIVVMVVIFLGGATILDRIDRYEVDSHVIAIERLDEQVVTFEDENGNMWVEYFDYEDAIDIGDEAILTIKEYETIEIDDDMVVNVEWVE